MWGLSYVCFGESSSQRWVMSNYRLPHYFCLLSRSHSDAFSKPVKSKNVLNSMWIIFNTHTFIEVLTSIILQTDKLRRFRLDYPIAMRVFWCMLLNPYQFTSCDVFINMMLIDWRSVFLLGIFVFNKVKN